MAHSSPRAPISFVDNAGLSTVDSFMRREAAGARLVMVCVGYVSERGMERLADWLEFMDPDGKLLLLVGMPPRHWKFLAKSAEAHATYLLRSMQTRASALDPELWQRLADQQQAGRLWICLREPRHSMHAKLYLIKSGPHTWKGLAGSSNLSASGLTQPGEFNQVLDATAAAQASDWLKQQWNATSSHPADDVWRELLHMTTPASAAGPRDRAGCWTLVLGLPLAGGLLFLLLFLPG